MTDWKNKYKALIREIEGIDMTMGIYPASVSGYGKEKDYKERDGYKNGWNAAVLDYGSKFAKVVDRAEEGISDDLEMLLSAGMGWLEDDIFVINLSDTWFAASSDGEEVTKKELSEVARLFRLYGRCGLLYWVYKKRGHYTQFKDNNRFIEFVEKEEELIQKEPDYNKRAYLKYKYKIGK